MTQFYLTEAENEYVIRGNSAVMKCKIPSFVADFVQVDAWVADDGRVHSYNDQNYGTGGPKEAYRFVRWFRIPWGQTAM